MNFHPFRGLQLLPDLPDAAQASREDLVAEMLGLRAHPVPGLTPAALRVSDRETPPEDPATQQLLTRRLGVARELLMRELRDRKAGDRVPHISQFIPRRKPRCLPCPPPACDSGPRCWPACP